MTFNAVALKNFRHNIKQYISFFACSAFSILLTFLYVTLIFNDSLWDEMDREDAPLNLAVYTIVAGLAIFAVLFISYVHKSFIKNRYREFAIYMTLGMTKKDIRKLILAENLVIIAASLFTGLITGALFSKLFQTTLLKMLNIDNIKYMLDYRSFIVTTLAFLLIFGFVLLDSLRITKNFTINNLLKKSRKNDISIKPRLIPCLISIIVFAAFIITLITMANITKCLEHTSYYLPVILAILISCFFLISNLSMFVLYLIKKHRKTYNNNIIVVTEMASKFKTNRSIIYLLAVLSSVIIMFIASPFSLTNLSYTIAGNSCPTSLTFISIDKNNPITNNQYDNFITEHKSEIKNNFDVSFIEVKPHTPSTENQFEKLELIKYSDYEKYVSKDNPIKDGEMIVSTSDWVPGKKGISEGTEVSLNIDNNRKFKVAHNLTPDSWLYNSYCYPCTTSIVVTDNDYEKLLSSASQNDIGIVHSINLKDYSKGNKLGDELKSIFNENGQKENLKYRLITKQFIYEGLKGGYSFFLFIAAMAGILFFIASSVVIFFKQYNDIDYMKQKYNKLSKIGISQKEIKKNIAKETSINFIVPLFFGIIIGYTLIYFVCKLVGGATVMEEFMKNTTIIVLAYIVLQFFAFLLSYSKFSKAIMRKK